MGFKNGAYAKVWDVEEKDGRMSARISISKKNKDGGYDQTFSGFVRVHGDAVGVFRECKGGRVQLEEVDVTNRYDKEKKTTTTYCHVYSAKAIQGVIPMPDEFIAVADGLEEDGLPFA